MNSLPPILDVRDDLERARETSDADVDDDVDDALARLDEFTDRDRDSRGTVLDTLDNQLLAVRERLDGEAARRLEAARNRIQLYRNAREGGPQGVAVVDTTIRPLSDDEVEADGGVPGLRGREAEVVVTVANSQEASAVRPEVRFYDDENQVLAEEVGETARFDAGEERRTSVSAVVPDVADYYSVELLPAGEGS